MSSKPTKLTVMVSGPVDAGKTHLLSKLKEFLDQTYGTDVKIKVDSLALSRYDGHLNGPARPHRGTVIELVSRTEVPNLILDTYQEPKPPAEVVRSPEFKLRVHLTTGDVFKEDGVAGFRVTDPEHELTPDAYCWYAATITGTAVPPNPFEEFPGYVHTARERLSIDLDQRKIYRWDTQQEVCITTLSTWAQHWAEIYGVRRRKGEWTVSSDDYRIYIRLPICSVVRYDDTGEVEPWERLSAAEFDWGLSVLRRNECESIAQLIEWRRRPEQIGLGSQEATMTKRLRPRKRLSAWIRERLWGKPQETYTLDELQVTKEAFVENVSAPRPAEGDALGWYHSDGTLENKPFGQVQAAHYAAASRPPTTPVEESLEDLFQEKPLHDCVPKVEVTPVGALRKLMPDDFEKLFASQGLRTPNDMIIKVTSDLKPVEVDDYTLTPRERDSFEELLAPDGIQTPEGSQQYARVDNQWVLAPEGKLNDGVTEQDATDYLAEHYPDSLLVDEATEEVIARLGGIVPHHHGHARKVMPLEGPTGKKSNYNPRLQKQHGKKKPRK